MYEHAPPDRSIDGKVLSLTYNKVCVGHMESYRVLSDGATHSNEPEHFDDPESDESQGGLAQVWRGI